VSIVMDRGWLASAGNMTRVLVPGLEDAMAAYGVWS
jgi:hypothetical protein